MVLQWCSGTEVAVENILLDTGTSTVQPWFEVILCLMRQAWKIILKILLG